MDSLTCLYLQVAIAFLWFTQLPSNTQGTADCIAGERSTLLAVRAGLTDHAGLLSSWKGDDCCRWKGVHCSKRTSHVLKLDLRGPDCDNSISSKQVLGGNISSRLLGLQHLQYLDLSCNRFSGVRIPEFLGSLHNLRYLSLSLSGFAGKIPPQLGNLSNLHSFSLDSIFDPTYSTDITWLSRLTSIEHLDMSSVNLSTISNWVPVVNMLPSLKVLLLPGCLLSSSPVSLRHSNLTSLETLDISANHFNKHITPNWFWDLTRLKQLDISYCGFSGLFPNELGNMTSMVKLRLSSNYLVGMIPSNLENLCSLEELFLSENNINESITEFFHRLPSCSWNKLSKLFLPSSNLTGSLPTELEPLRNLTWLYLSDNKLTGPMPLWIGELTKLTLLVLSSNYLDGSIHEGHLSGLANLDELFLSDNSVAIIVNPTWVSPFSLTTIELRSCLLGPKFPTWLKWQTRVDNLDISNTSIADIVPDWFWITASSVSILNMRHNQIRGFLPLTMEFMGTTVMDLSSNKLSGPVPKLPVNLTNLDLSRNIITGPLPSDFGAPLLATLVLFENSISGGIPSSLCKLRSLRLLDLSGNELSGSIPDCLLNESTTTTTSMNILNLSLQNNHLSGDFPSFIQHCNKLIFLDLAYNQFSGTLPAWIGDKLSSLSFLRLRSNMFYGHIPMELTKLSNLQYLDLAYNNITGSIPKNIGKCTGMTLTGDEDDEIEGALDYGMSFGLNEVVDYTENFTVVTKGQERLYTGEIIYMVNLDLSCNGLIGEVPGEIGSLVALKNLNLSWNGFSGNIPEKIGALVQVESLDLSHNELCCEIPASFSALTSLSHLNLSYNNLTGEIPTGSQLQTLEDQASIYVGNPGLCGPPLSNNCPQADLIPVAQKNHEDVSDMVSLYLSMVFGYVVGLWVVFCTFLFKRKWRVRLFSLYDSLYDGGYVKVAVSWASWRRNNG